MVSTLDRTQAQVIARTITEYGVGLEGEQAFRNLLDEVLAQLPDLDSPIMAGEFGTNPKSCAVTCNYTFANR